MLGGVPENYAVVLTSPSSDERELLIRRFIETGVKAGQTTFLVTVEAGFAKFLAEDFQSNFYLFLCNPRAEVMVKNLPNVFKLKGVESLTDIDISLTKSFRMLDPTKEGPKIACNEIVSDVLLQHRAVVTRKWLSGLIPELRSKGFTTLAVVNPQMHPPEEVQAILGLFEGEIRISEKETASGLKKVLRVRKLYNQRYMETELVLSREKLEL
jgi:KaiC/GvpD/RAD55 family RecA-like ATPase